MLMQAGTVFGLFFLSLWLIYYIFERDAEKATERFSKALFSRLIGAVATFAVFAGELASAAGELMAIIMGIPSLIIALLGFGSMAGHVDMSPGMFLVVALIVFLGARAVTSSRAG